MHHTFTVLCVDILPKFVYNNDVTYLSGGNPCATAAGVTGVTKNKSLLHS